MQITTERKILISNKSFLDFSEDVFNDLLVEYQNAPIEARAAVANLAAEITGELYKRLFNTDLDNDLI